MFKKFFLGLAPLIAVAAFALLPSAAAAAECRVLSSFKAKPAAGKCHEPPGVAVGEAQNLRANTDKFEIGTEKFEGFGADALTVNTHGPIRFRAKIAGIFENNESPTGYAFFGLQLKKNPVGKNEKPCPKAEGEVSFVDIQDGKPSGVFKGEKAWTITVNSDLCEESPGLVTVSGTQLLFETLGVGKAPVVSSGSFTGKYEQPGTICPAGGVKLEINQPGITTKPAAEEVKVDNAAGENAYICFVSSNNYLFPKTAPTWSPFTNINAEEGTGIWKS